MLKYLYYKELFAEIPEEITLGISISGCKIHCEGCHSKELWEDMGTVLTIDEFSNLLEQHKGVSCVCLFGGEHDIDHLSELFEYAHGTLKTAWYCGLSSLPKDKMHILEHLDYLKLGPYDKNLGGLDSPESNQHFYKIVKVLNNKSNDYVMEDITYKFKKHEVKNKS